MQLPNLQGKSIDYMLGFQDGIKWFSESITELTKYSEAK